MGDRSWLRADELAVALRDDGWSLDVIDAAVERAAILHHDGKLGELHAYIEAAMQAVDTTPAERRRQRSEAA